MDQYKIKQNSKIICYCLNLVKFKNDQLSITLQLWNLKQWIKSLSREKVALQLFKPNIIHSDTVKATKKQQSVKMIH